MYGMVYVMDRTTTEPLPNDIDALKEIICGLRDSYTKLEEEKEVQAREANKQIDILQELVAFFKDRLDGPRSEKWSEEDNRQMLLFNEAELGQSPAAPDEEAIVVPEHSRRKRGRKPIPAHFPRIEVLCDLDESQKICGCGAGLVVIGEETSEKLDIIPAQIRVIRYIRPKYACRACEGVENEEAGAVQIAPPAPQMIPKGLASAGLLAHVLVSKFEDALPFYRQEKLFRRIGVDIPRATMCNWAMKVAGRSEILLELMHEELLAGPLIGIDETPLQVIVEPGRAATTKSYMWVFVGGPPDRPVILFVYHPTRSGSVPLSYLEGYQGYAQTDGYTAYDAFGRQPGVIMLGCWAHARRKFFDLIKITKKAENAVEAVRRIKGLYAIEHEADKLELDAEERQLLRQEKALPILNSFKEWADAKLSQVPPKSLLGKAFKYAVGQWDRLVGYTENGILRIDNNVPLCSGYHNPQDSGKSFWERVNHAAAA